MSTTTLITADEYAQMNFPETERYELVEGELVPLPSGTPRHCLIRDLIGDTVRAYLRKNPIGRAIHELDCRSENELYTSEITAWRVQKLILHPERMKK